MNWAKDFAEQLKKLDFVQTGYQHTTKSVLKHVDFVVSTVSWQICKLKNAYFVVPLTALAQYVVKSYMYL